MDAIKHRILGIYLSIISSLSLYHILILQSISLGDKLNYCQIGENEEDLLNTPLSTNNELFNGEFPIIDEEITDNYSNNINIINNNETISNEFCLKEDTLHNNNEPVLSEINISTTYGKKLQSNYLCNSNINSYFILTDDKSRFSSMLSKMSEVLVNVSTFKVAKLLIHLFCFFKIIIFNIYSNSLSIYYIHSYKGIFL
jgi:hypothetical protein